MKRITASTAWAWSLPLLLAAACGEEVRHLPGRQSELILRLRPPPLQDPFAGLAELRLVLRAPDGGETEWRLDGAASQGLVLGEPAQGVSLRVEGLDLEQRVLSSGQSAPFDLEPGQPAVVEVLFARAGELTPLAGKLQRARFGHTLTVLGDGRVLVLGGAGQGSPEAPGALVEPELYTPAAQASCLLGEPGCAPTGPGLLRYGHAACASREGDAFIHGGRDAAGALETSVLVFRHQSDTWLPVPGVNLEAVRPRTEHAMAAVGLLDGSGGSRSAVLLAGGLGPGREALSDAAVLDATTLSFTRMGVPLGRARAGHSLTPIGAGGQRLLVAGGHDQAGLVAEVELFDGADFGPIPVEGALARADLAVPRLRHAAVPLGDDVLVLGGDDGLLSLAAPELVTLEHLLGRGVVPLQVSATHAGHRSRRGALAAPLPAGEVLWVGGEHLDGFESQMLDSAERVVPDPGRNQAVFEDAAAGRLGLPIAFPGLAVLPGGGVLLMGGLGREAGGPLASDAVWYYNPR